MADYEAISDSEKARIASEFLMHAPPGEFNEVFNDVRILVNNDKLLKENCSETFSQYDKDQMHAVSLEGQEDKCLITQHNNLEANVFHDPNSQKSFKYDHLKKTTSDVTDHVTSSDATPPPLRKALDEKVREMVGKYYGASGSCGVFYKGTPEEHPVYVVCIENHKFQPANMWNGRWRSEYTVTVQASEAVVEGVVKVQIHYFEDGNIQLVSKRDVRAQYINHGLSNTGDSSSEAVEALAKNVTQKILSVENEYQKAVTENYVTMSDTTFKALRRQLPITRSLISWEKILGYKIGNELDKRHDKA